MTTALPPTLIEFIHRCIPTLQAAEVLLFFAAHDTREFRPEEVAVAIRPIAVSVPAVREYVTLLLASGLLTEDSGRFRFGAKDPDLQEAVQMLGAAYNERPVTLIAEIYRIADGKLQSFADSFRFRQGEP